MKINVLLFGISADLVGASTLELDLLENANVSDFKSTLQKEYSNLTQLNSYAIAVNESYADETTILKENDVVAVIPPVSGG
jgi:molybdopterin converting factor subunit 1